MKLTKSSITLPIIISVMVLLIGGTLWIYNSSFSVRARLAAQGIGYDEDSTVFASPTLTEFNCWYEKDGVRYEGPRITGTLLEVVKPSTSSEGVFTFTVRCRSEKSKFSKIELTLPPVEDRAFHVTNSAAKRLNIHYPQEDLIGAP